MQCNVKPRSFSPFHHYQAAAKASAAQQDHQRLASVARRGTTALTNAPMAVAPVESQQVPVCMLLA